MNIRAHHPHRRFLPRSGSCGQKALLQMSVRCAKNNTAKATTDGSGKGGGRAKAASKMNSPGDDSRRRRLWGPPDMMSALEGGGGHRKCGCREGGCLNF